MTIDLGQHPATALPPHAPGSDAVASTAGGPDLPRTTRAYLLRPATADRAGDVVAAVAYARSRGWAPVSPASVDVSHDGECPHGRRYRAHPRACWYAAEVGVLQGCDLVLLLPGWQTCADAPLQFHVAMHTDMPFAFVPPLLLTTRHLPHREMPADPDDRAGTDMPGTAAGAGRGNH